MPPQPKLRQAFKILHSDVETRKMVEERKKQERESNWARCRDIYKLAQARQKAIIGQSLPEDEKFRLINNVFPDKQGYLDLMRKISACRKFHIAETFCGHGPKCMRPTAEDVSNLQKLSGVPDIDQQNLEEQAVDVAEEANSLQDALTSPSTPAQTDGESNTSPSPEITPDNEDTTPYPGRSFQRKDKSIPDSFKADPESAPQPVPGPSDIPEEAKLKDNLVLFLPKSFRMVWDPKISPSNNYYNNIGRSLETYVNWVSPEWMQMLERALPAIGINPQLFNRFCDKWKAIAYWNYYHNGGKLPESFYDELAALRASPGGGPHIMGNEKRRKVVAHDDL